MQRRWQKLQVGGQASVRDLIVGLHGATGAEGGPIVAQLIEATRRLAAAWSELFDRARRQEQALSGTRDHAARVAGQLHGMVGAVRDALHPLPTATEPLRVQGRKHTPRRQWLTH